MSNLSTKRLTKELAELQKKPPGGVTLESADNLSQWVVKVEGAKDTLYQNEVFWLRFTFPSNYPLESPEVVFVRNIPIHPHIYSNGHICLSILYDHWSPALTISSVCLSILSMLSSCTNKERPPDDSRYVAHAAKSPKQTNWAFHDDTV
ncbi:ubiquitin-conjugating enzyme [Gonapodya prolifera JEL478]|uniref:N-terminal E2 ubiquitin-conjugating enzyme n=1 Tax=Gonapodya prolifera (strain JEL478) TaxID=1344416 RepID=A0A139AU54_GONPJ|nr:ubiquitin-conjugating enzyme [Gonapodya prolifera JEL478]|eukprot:KXS20248.1 ubiquitin-conjugating enzyme [Gonapodya prolifera JEL478]